jgi:acetyl-CoA decarbonylase/synthase complex subunit gamma
MALTGIQIFKLLPKTNCKECGVPTCLAFAMNLASGKAELDSCPYVSDDARAQLAEASAPPIRPVVVGAGVRKATTGGETVQYRHEKTFYNPTLLGALVNSDIAADALAAKLTQWNALQFERVGLNLRPELVAVKDVNGDAGAFAAVAKQVAETSEFNVVLMSDNVDVMTAGVAATAFKRPLIYGANAANIDAFGALAKDNDLPVAVVGESVEALVPLTEKLTAMGIKDIVLDLGFPRA